MINIFDEQYTQVMRRALLNYQEWLKDNSEAFENFESELHNVELMIQMLDQLPELMRLFMGNSGG